MAFDLPLHSYYEFEIDAPYEEVFALLSDVPAALGLHPNTQTVIDQGEGVYRCETKKLGTEKHKMQTIYTCQYSTDKASGTITWTPVANGGNSEVDGRFDITDQGTTTRVVMDIKSVMHLPLPGLLKGMAERLIKAENHRLSKLYIDNLIGKFGSGRLIHPT